MNLVPAIKAIEQEMRNIKYEYEKKIQPLQEGLDKLRELNDVCETCGGKGKVLRHRICAEDDRPDPDDPNDYMLCLVCCGSGKKTMKGTE